MLLTWLERNRDMLITHAVERGDASPHFVVINAAAAWTAHVVDAIDPVTLDYGEEQHMLTRPDMPEYRFVSRLVV